MPFDETSYVRDFIKKVRGASVLPDDLMARYAITLPASDGEIAAQLKGVRAYWNKTYLGKSTVAQVAKLCRAEDERLRAEHGARMETRNWWERRQSERQSAAEAAIARLAEELRQRYGQLGVVTGGILEKFAAKLGLNQTQAAQAVDRAGLRLAPAVALPETEPIPTFAALVKSMSECGVASVPELVHPGSGAFKLVDRYVCLADPGKRLDVTAVETRITEADKRGISATENARRSALMILRKAVRDGVDLRDVALYHLVAVAGESAELSAGMAVDELGKAGLDRADAAVIAVLLTEHGSAARTAGVGKIRELVRTGRLTEASQAARDLPENSGHRAEAIQVVNEARQQLDALLAQAMAAAEVPDEIQAAKLLKDAAQISAEDAEEVQAAIPLPPPAGLRAVCESAAVKLFWRPAAGHDAGTVYVVGRTEQRPPAAASDGVQVYRDHGDACTDARAPVARPLNYGVFALADGRPPSRPAVVAVTVLPPVSRLEAEVGAAAIALRWSAHPDAQEVRVTRSAPGVSPQRVPATRSGCQVTGLAEGQTQHFEITAVYHGLDGAELASAAQQINAIPRSEAQPIPMLRVRLVEAGDAVRTRVSWKPVDKSEVRIMRSASPPPWKFGTWVSQHEMAGYGQEVTGRTITGRAETGLEAELPAGVHHLVPFSIGGTGIVTGRAAAIAVTDPVRHLKVTPFATYATVSWEWPPGIQLAEVSWEIDGEADCTLVNVAQYRSAGGARGPLGRGACAIEVRAVIMIGEASFTAPPARIAIDAVAEVAVAYSVSGVPPIGPFGGRSKKVVFRSDQACGKVHVRMVAAPGLVMPTSPDVGVIVLDTTLTLEPGIPVEHQISVPKAVKRPYWLRCFAVDGGARLIDPPISSLKET